MDQRVIDFYNRYQTRKQSYPSLYESGKDSINVILPNSLLEFANAAAGHSGFGAGARARGIRRQVANAASALAKIFASPENLLIFLEGSEKNADAYVTGVRAKHLARAGKAKSATDDRPANEVFFKKYTQNDATALRAKFTRELVLREFNLLTINEFELRFGLSQEMEVA